MELLKDGLTPFVERELKAHVSVRLIQESAGTRSLAICRSLLKVADFLESQPFSVPKQPTRGGFLSPGPV
ncbi:MAG: hypothetical protein ACRD3M_12845 [Thermoanaerobaculia bacterium]